MGEASTSNIQHPEKIEIPNNQIMIRSNRFCMFAPFPLTPTLSPPRGSRASARRSRGGGDLLRTGEASPSPWGEGWGEGERDRRQKGTSYMRLELPTGSVEEPDFTLQD